MDSAEVQTGLAGVRDLSAREREVLIALGEGLTVSECADRMGLSVKTVSTYRTRILEKLSDAGVLRGYSTNALMRYAMRTGLVSTEVQ